MGNSGSKPPDSATNTNPRLYSDPWSGEMLTAIDTDRNYLSVLGLAPPNLNTSPTHQLGLPGCVFPPSFGALYNSLLYMLPIIAPTQSTVLTTIWATRYIPSTLGGCQYSTLLRFSPLSSQPSKHTFPHFQSAMFNWVPNTLDNNQEVRCASGVSTEMTWDPIPEQWEFPPDQPKAFKDAQINFTVNKPALKNTFAAVFPHNNPLNFDGVEYAMNYWPQVAYDPHATVQTNDYRYSIDPMFFSFNHLANATEPTLVNPKYGNGHGELTIHASMPHFDLKYPKPTSIYSLQTLFHNAIVPFYLFVVDVTDLTHCQLLWRWFDCFRVLWMQNSPHFNPDIPLLIIMLNSVTNLDEVVLTESAILEECGRFGLYEVHFFRPACSDFLVIPASLGNTVIEAGKLTTSQLQTFESYLHWSTEHARLCGLIDRLLADHIYRTHIEGKTVDQQQHNPYFLTYHHNYDKIRSRRIFPLYNIIQFPNYMLPPTKDARGRLIVPLQRDYVPVKAICGSCPQLPDGTIKPTSTKHTSLTTILATGDGLSSLDDILYSFACNFLAEDSWAMASGPPPYSSARFLRGKLVYQHARIRKSKLQLGACGMAKFVPFESQTQNPIWYPGNALFRHFTPPPDFDSTPQESQPVVPSPRRIHANISFLRFDQPAPYHHYRPLLSSLWGTASIIFPFSLTTLAQAKDETIVFQQISSQLALFDYFGFQTCPVYFIFVDNLPTEPTAYGNFKFGPMSVFPFDYPHRNMSQILNSISTFLSRIHPTCWSDHRVIRDIHINVGFCKPPRLQHVLIDVQRMALHEYALHFHKHTYDELLAAHVSSNDVQFALPIEGEPALVPPVQDAQDSAD